MEVMEPSAADLLGKGRKRTEVGVVPADWEVKALHSLAEKITVGIANAATHAYRDRGVVMFRNQNIKPNRLDDCDVLYIDELFEQRYCNKRLRAGDLLTARTGYPGTTSIVPAGYDGAQTFTTLITRPRTTLVDPQYLCFFINSDAGQRYIQQSQAGGGQKNVNAGSLKFLNVALPPTMAEQKSIAEALSDAGALIESLEQLLLKKRQIKRGVMRELLTGKRRLPGFTEAWKKKRIGEITDCTAGGTPSTLVPRYWGEPIRWMSSGDLHLKFVAEVEGRITEEGLRNSSTKMLPANCVLVGLAGQGRTRGTVAINLVPLCTNQSIAAIFPEQSFVPQFLYYSLDSRYEELRELSAGDGGRGGLNLTIIRALTVSIPSVEEQSAIAALLSDLDHDIEALKARLAKARQVEQGMMQQLLTGRIRLVKQAATVVRSTTQAISTSAGVTSHNWQINEAVVISVLTKCFGSERFPLGRKRCTKLSYLLHRHVERTADGYLKKAAGPFNPSVKYKGPEDIARRNGYIRRHRREQYAGFIADENIGQAEAYFAKWYGAEQLVWLEQFRHKTNDELELMATVDMAMVDLRRSNIQEQLVNVKRVIREHPEWEAKLTRSIFSDDNIVSAMKSCQRLFGAEE